MPYDPMHERRKMQGISDGGTRLPTAVRADQHDALWRLAGAVRGFTKRGYPIWLRKFLLPTFGEMPLNTITVADVVEWYEGWRRPTL